MPHLGKRLHETLLFLMKDLAGFPGVRSESEGLLQRRFAAEERKTVQDRNGKY